MTPAALVIAQLILQYGPPLAMQIYQIITKETITPDDIKALSDIKPPSAYLTLSYITKTA
jgi:hypothetical protein